MYKIKKTKSIVGFLMILLGEKFAHANDFSRKLADAYLKSFPSEEEESFDFNKLDKKDFDIRKSQPVKMTYKNNVDVSLNVILNQSTYFESFVLSRDDVTNEYFWMDLHILYGTTIDPTYTLLNRLKKTSTVLGESFFASMLVSPCSNIENLKRRQELVRFFYENDKVLEYFDKLLQKYASSEKGILSLYTERDPLYSPEYIKYMESYYYGNINSESSLNSGVLEFKKRFFRDFCSVIYNVTYPILNAVVFDIINFLFSSNEEYRKDYVRPFIYKGSVPIWGLYSKYQTLDSYHQNNYDKRKEVVRLKDFANDIGGIAATSTDLTRKTVWGDGFTSTMFLFFGILPELLYISSVYKAVKNYQEYSLTLRSLAERMSDLQIFFKTIKAISDYVASDSKLEKLYGHKIKEIRKFLSHYKKISEDGRFITYMLDLPLKNWSYFLDNAGKLLSSFTLFVKNKKNLVNALAELSELDAHISVVKLIKDAEKYCDEKKFTFVKILNKKESTMPYLKIEGMWNPMLDAKAAVMNNVEMQNNLRNIVLTGPNAGGKSVYLTGVAISILLAQSFGIAPVKEMIITPFTKISTYIYIADDLADETSLFKAEVKRAQKHMQTIKSLKANEFAFTIFDEPFNGTNPKEGAAAEYSILKVLSKYKNTLNIVATHYPIVILLEKNIPEGAFKNYKVYILEGTKVLNYTYKVIPGHSTQTIAIRILEEQGFDTSLLQRARDILKNPDKYKSDF